jgi:hypothetical protein
MRVLGAVVVTVLCAGVASAQSLWVGAAAGTSWEWDSPTAPGQHFLHSANVTPTAFVGLPIDEDTTLRLRGVRISKKVAYMEQSLSASLTGVTIGIDYFLPSVIGDAVFSGGVGDYRLSVNSGQVPSTVADQLEGSRFGWYVGVGEWFIISRRARFTLEFTMDRTGHHGHPTLITGAAGLAFAF